jgi:hypothetical protein
LDGKSGLTVALLLPGLDGESGLTVALLLTGLDDESGLTVALLLARLNDESGFTVALLLASLDDENSFTIALLLTDLTFPHNLGFPGLVSISLLDLETLAELLDLDPFLLKFTLEPNCLTSLCSGDFTPPQIGLDLQRIPGQIVPHTLTTVLNSTTITHTSGESGRG